MLTKGCWETAGEVLYADVLLLPNGMSKVGNAVKTIGLLGLSFFFPFVVLFGNMVN